MIKINIIKNNDFVSEITVKGHSNFDSYGKDIVCAAVSSIVITTLNALIRLDENQIEYRQEDGFTYVKVIKRNDINKILFENMISLLEELEKKYPKNIMIK